MADPSRTVGRLQLMALASEAGCDPRTIAKALKNEPIRGIAGERARRVLAEHGLIDDPQPQRASA